MLFGNKNIPNNETNVYFQAYSDKGEMSFALDRSGF